MRLEVWLCLWEVRKTGSQTTNPTEEGETGSLPKLTLECALL